MRTRQEIAADLEEDMAPGRGQLDQVLTHFGNTGGGSDEERLRALIHEAIEALRRE